MAETNIDTLDSTKPKKERPKKKKQRKKNTITKDPADAYAYLEAWKNQNSWKFNKNTQSWLIRHMYRADQLNKTGFQWMAEYIRHGSEPLRHRVLQEARRRALRYQAYSDAPDKDSHTKEDAEWQGLSDHDKRKEYKRARKLLEVVAVPVEKRLDK